MVAKMKTVFYQVHADDVTLQTWPAYEAFIGLGLIDAIKIDLLTCIAAFQIMVRSTPTSPEVLYFMEHRLAHEGAAIIISETLKILIINTLTSHRDMVVILEATVDRDIIDKHFGDVARRIYVQGGSTCALAFLPCSHASMHPCIHAATHPCILIHAPMQPCIHASMHPCIMHACMHPCMHECIFCWIACILFCNVNVVSDSAEVSMKCIVFISLGRGSREWESIMY